jgi:V8-like Glu-specific endopeptidase
MSLLDDGPTPRVFLQNPRDLMRRLPARLLQLPRQSLRNGRIVVMSEVEVVQLEENKNTNRPMFRNQKPKALAAVACAIALVSASSSSARVIGEDGRRAVSQEEQRRYSAIGLVVVSAGGRVYGGTGTLINDQFTVLTAFHNVFHDGRTGRIGQVQAPLRMMHFSIGDRLTRHRIKSIRPFNREYGGFVLADENDLAILTLAQPVVGVEPLSLRALGPEEDGRGVERVTLVAFAGLKKSVQECSFHERAGSYPRSADVLVHDCDSEGNASGAPLLDASGAIVAIHLGGSPRGVKIDGRPFNSRLNFNIARRVTSEVQRFVDGDAEAH